MDVISDLRAKLDEQRAIVVHKNQSLARYRRETDEMLALIKDAKAIVEQLSQKLAEVYTDD